MAVLELKDVAVSYEDKTALDHVSVEIKEHQIIAIVGPSGCGKTTLLHCMNGMIHENAGVKVNGEILLDGKNLLQIPEEELRRRVGLVFQTPAPFPFSIYKNMVYAPKYYGINGKEKLDTLVKEKLMMAGLYEEVKDNLNKSAKKLSGGQQQRLCIARALTVEPEVLLLDEPCSALDVQSTTSIEEMLLEIKKQYTIVLVTHNIQQARRIADQTIFLQNGKLVEMGPTEELFENPKEEETRKFLQW